MPRYSDDERRERIVFSQDMFHQIEDNLFDFLDYVPLDFNHLEVYSYRLISIILEIGPELLSSFDIAINSIAHRLGKPGDSVSYDSEELCKKEQTLRKENKSLTFTHYYDFLNKHWQPKLSSVPIGLKDSDMYIMPFEESYPKWWITYNKLRHDKYPHLRTATLKTALNACAALFWIVHQNQEFGVFSSDLFGHASSGVLSRLRKI